MLKVTLVPCSPPKQDIYPCLKIASSGRIVLFTALKVGTQVSETGGLLGNHSVYWAPEDFKPFHDIVQLHDSDD